MAHRRIKIVNQIVEDHQPEHDERSMSRSYLFCYLQEKYALYLIFCFQC